MAPTEVLADKAIELPDMVPTKELRRFLRLWLQSLGILKTQRLWKFNPQFSHFKPCLNIPNNISPQKLQNVGVLYECTIKEWGLISEKIVNKN